MRELVLDLQGEQATCRLGTAIGRLLLPGDAVLLEGPLGAGKTTLARAILRAACNAPALEVPSPTYTLLQEYESPMGPITHFDLWRLDGPRALEELGWREARDGIVIVEWPDRLAGAGPANALSVTLSSPAEGPRRAFVAESPRPALVAGWQPDRLAALAAAAGRPR